MNYKYFLFLLVLTINTIAQNKNNSIGFKENKGQVIDQNGNPNNAVKYLLNTNGLNVQLKQNGFSYDIYETKKIPIKQRIEENNTFSSIAKNDKKAPDYSLEYTFHRIDIDFVNSNPNVELISNEESKDYDNYYNVPDKPEGIVNVHQYQQITYKNIYPNIDVVFSIPKDSLKAVEYNFVVHPNGKISDIQLKFNGAKTELVDNKIRMNVRFGQMEEILPASWTEDGNHKKEIAVTYKKIKKDVYGFNTSNSVNGKTVIIDPVPVRLWGTFYGDERNIHYTLGESSITVDSYGNSYMAGTTTASNSSYVTTGAHQNSIPSYAYLSSNGIIVKFSSDGNRMWGTYYGGQGLNTINDIKIDSQNNAVIIGSTPSTSNISTTGTHKSNLSGGSDAFLVKFNDSGIRLWGTYFGGENDDAAYCVDIDKNNNIYLAGRTLSNTSIAINSNFQTQLNDGYYKIDGFLAKFKSDGNLIWSTYVGGEGQDELKTIVVKDNYLVTGGNTNSFNNITTLGVFQENHDLITHPDGVVYKFSLDGHRIWATYYGGEQVDYVYAIEIDDEDNVYIGGETASTTNLTTPNSFDSSNQYLYKGFFAKLNSNGQRIWGSYLGAAKVYSLLFKNNSIYIGATNSGFSNAKLTTPCSYRPSGNFEGYIGKFSKQGDLIWGSFVGGEGSSNSTRIAFDNNNSIFVSGISRQNNGIADNSSYQPSILGTFSNYFLMKFSEDIISSPIISSNSPICIGNTLELKASGGTDYLWTGPNGFTSTEQNPTINNTTSLNSGEYTCSITGVNVCDGIKKINIIIGDIQAPIPDLATLPTITGDCNTIITTTPTATDVCAGAIIGTTNSPLSYNLPGTYTVIWNYNDGNGNSVNQNQTVIITNQPLPAVNNPQIFCIQQNATLSSITITGQNIKWYDTLTNGNLLSNTASLQNGKTYYASQTINGCESDRIPVLINIQNTPAPTGDTNQSFCSTQNATLNDVEITGTNIKWYNSSNIELPNTTVISNNATYYVTQSINNCESVNKLAVNTTLINTLNANNYKVEFCDENNDGKETLNLSVFNPNLIANPTDNSFSYYTSLVAAENQIANNRINNINNYVLPTGSYTVFVRIDSPNSCYQIVELNLNLYSKPVIPIDDIMPICEGSSIDINAGNGYDNYLWSTGETSPTITIQNPGNYSVTVTNDYDSISCSSTKDFTVKNSTIATITTIETQDWTDNQNTIKVFATGEGDFEYSIDGIHFQDSNEFSNVISGQYTAHVRDKNGCGTVTEEVYLLMYPKFFTPNGDGYNDTWKIKFSDNEKNITIKIFDRYGKLLKALLPDASWNGQLNNQELPATDYWFIATRADGKKYKGHFSLKR